MQYIYNFLMCTFFLCVSSFASEENSREVELSLSTSPIPQSAVQQRRQMSDSNISQTDGRPHESTHLRQIAAAENKDHYFYHPVLYYYSLCSAIFWDIAKDKFGLGMILFPALAMASFQWAPYAPTNEQDYYNSRGQLCLLVGMVCGTMQAYSAIVGPAREKQVVKLLKLWKKAELAKRAVEEGNLDALDELPV
jgi:hypothetical protein